MLIVPHRVAASLISGVGVHAAEPIQAGATVWALGPADVQRERIDGMDEAGRALWEKHAFLSPTRNVWVLCSDAARFLNFAEKPNLWLGPLDEFGEHSLVAARDIAPGEEITVGFESDKDSDRKMVAHLVQESMELVYQALTVHSRPVQYISFGKDSVLLLHLLRDFGVDLPIIFHREAFAPERYRFADRLIKDWNLTCLDYPPVRSSLWRGREIMSFVRHFEVGPAPSSILTLPKNISELEDGKSFACAVDDIFGSRHASGFQYPFDLAIIGHRGDDSDQIAGKVPLRSNWVEQADAPTAIFPLKNWTARNVFWYIRRFNVPIQEDRYDVAGGREQDSKETNSDWFRACTSCCEPGEGQVLCPRSGTRIDRREVPWFDGILPSYVGEEGVAA